MLDGDEIDGNVNASAIYTLSFYKKFFFVNFRDLKPLIVYFGLGY